jgi:peptidoglycan-associated lipoprotein
MTANKTITSSLATAIVLAGIALSGCGPDYPNCDTDTDCHQGEFCVNGLCQQCRGDQDCAAGQRCASGACQAVPGYCTSASDCAEGEECENNLCVSRAAQSLPPAPAPVAGGCQLESVYFGFDQSTLDDSARNQLGQVASCVRERSVKAVHLTGLTDPRGTEEYNMALGDRRAQSAKSYLKSLGVEADVSASSKGEELSSGSDESSWARDRRVDVRER